MNLYFNNLFEFFKVEKHIIYFFYKIGIYDYKENHDYNIN